MPSRRRPPRRSRCRRSGRAAPRPTEVLVCPISPAAPGAPRSSWPPDDDADARCRWTPSRTSGPGAARGARAARTAPSRWRRCRRRPGRRRSARRRNGASSTPSQPDMIGESRLAPRAKSTVPGMRQPHRAYGVRRPAELVEQGLERRPRPAASGPRRPDPTSWSRSTDASTLAVEVAHPELGAAAADRAGQHDAGVPVEAQVDRRPAAGRGARSSLGALDDQPGARAARRAGRRPPSGTGR